PAEGRKVRCKKCGHVWHQAAEAGQAEIEETIFNPPPESEPVPVAEPETEAEAPQPSWRAPAVEDDAAEDDFHLDAPESPAKRGMGAVLVMLGWAALVVVI